MRIVLTGGGTGGHIYPALAIAKGIQARKPDTEILYIGTGEGLEAKIVPAEGIPFKTITVGGLERKISFSVLKGVLKAFKGSADAFNILKTFKPDIVIGTGGYVAGPVVMVAALLRIPTLIHEQNAFPGVTNKLLARLVNKIAITFPESVKYFSNQDKTVITGLPVREEILQMKREIARAELGLTVKDFLILAVGGSRGAKSINQAMLSLHQNYAKTKNIRILHMTGNLDHEETLKALSDKSIELSGTGNIRVTPYVQNMAQALAAADLMVCRAGATTLAELTCQGVPAILIPYPFAAENHQEYNAKALVQQGAAELILDRQLTGEVLLAKVQELIENPAKLQEMGQNSLKLGKPQALAKIVDLVMNLAVK